MPSSAIGITGGSRGCRGNGTVQGSSTRTFSRLPRRHPLRLPLWEEYRGSETRGQADARRKSLSHLPHVRNQAEADPARVLRIPGQISPQDLLFVEKPPDEHGREEHDETERPPRTERQRYADEEPDGAG